jgi:hypothetical protein
MNSITSIIWDLLRDEKMHPVVKFLLGPIHTFSQYNANQQMKDLGLPRSGRSNLIFCTALKRYYMDMWDFGFAIVLMIIRTYLALDIGVWKSGSVEFQIVDLFFYAFAIYYTISRGRLWWEMRRDVKIRLRNIVNKP